MKTQIKTFFYLSFALLTLQSQISQTKKSPKEINNILQSGKEAQAVTDQVISDDLIVDGSICVGLDCVNGESFGFDTQRLKENNLRIRAFDTSTTASFPSNDWQITFNDSSNGGANKFSIDDIDSGRTPFTIEAGARSHALYVDDDGRIGVGTSTPVARIHSKDGNTPTLRLEQDGSAGFTPQTWDMAGNEANFFIRDATSGSTLPFRLFPGAPSNALTIEGSTGDIGLGTTSPDARLDIEDNEPIIRLTNTSSNAEEWEIGTNDSLFYVSNFTGESVPFRIADGAPDNSMYIEETGVYIKNAILPGASAPSDFRLKKDLVSISDATTVLTNLYPKTYFYKEEYVKKYGLSAQKQYGLVAQELEKVLPELVSSKKLAGKDDFKTVDYTSLVPVLIQGFKEQQALIDSQNKRIKSLEQKVSAYASLDARLNALENKSQNSTSNAKR